MSVVPCLIGTRGKWPETLLMIAGNRDGLVLTRTQFLCKLFELDIFVDCHDRWSEGLRVQLADELLQVWMQCSLTMIGRVGDTGNLSKFFGSAYQTGKGGGRHPIGPRSSTDPHPGQDGGDCRQVAMKMRLFLGRGQYRRIESRASDGRLRIKGEILSLG